MLCCGLGFLPPAPRDGGAAGAGRGGWQPLSLPHVTYWKGCGSNAPGRMGPGGTGLSYRGSSVDTVLPSVANGAVRCLGTSAGPLTSRPGVSGRGHTSEPPWASISSPVKWEQCYYFAALGSCATPIFQSILDESAPPPMPFMAVIVTFKVTPRSGHLGGSVSVRPSDPDQVMTSG